MCFSLLICRSLIRLACLFSHSCGLYSYTRSEVADVPSGLNMDSTPTMQIKLINFLHRIILGVKVKLSP
jgi:hypothetical protein